MKNNIIRCIFFCYVFFVCMISLSFAQTMKIKYVIENGAKLEGKKIVVEGEAIGHLMQRGEFAWVNINDKTECIGIWANYSELAKIENLGKYAVTGDWVRVSGVLNNRCAAHGGDTDIHAIGAEIIKKGSPRHFVYDQKKEKILIFLIGVLACLYIIKILKRLR